MALKVAPEQGWGIHWNEAHPDRPFTPVEVSLAPSVAANAGSSQGTALTAAPAALPQANSAPHVVAALEVPSASQVTSSAQPVSGAVAMAHNIGQFAALTVSAPVGALAFSTSSAADFDSGALHASLPDGWFIVPSAGNEYGQAYVAGDGLVWDVAAGEFSADWFFV